MRSQKDPLILLFQVGHSIQNLNKQSEELFGISLVQWCLLNQLQDMPGTSALQLANAVGVHPSTLTQTLKRLERKKNIQQMEDPRDFRKKVIYLTKTGFAEMKKMEKQVQKWARAVSYFERNLIGLNSVLSHTVKKEKRQRR